MDDGYGVQYTCVFLDDGYGRRLLVVLLQEGRADTVQRAWHAKRGYAMVLFCNPTSLSYKFECHY